jgi:hypothetical protein
MDANPWQVFSPLSETMRSLPSHRHSQLDDLVSVIRARNILTPHAFYHKGFGDVRRVVEVARDIQDVASSLRNPHAPPNEMEDLPLPHLELRATPHGREYAHVAEGRFPAPTFADALPPAARTVHFQVVTPTAWLHGPPSASPRPMVVILPGTGEHGFIRRRHMLAYPLAQAGVGSVILEGPFYGCRKDPSQWGSKLHTLASLPVLGRATIDEARTLLQWLRGRTVEEVRETVRVLPRGLVGGGGREGGGGGGGGGGGKGGESGGGGGWATPPIPTHPPPRTARPSALGEGGHAGFVVAGLSMGGLHAAMTCSLLPRSWDNVGWTSWLGPPSGVGVFTRGALAPACDWRAMASDVTLGRCVSGAGHSFHLGDALDDVESALIAATPGGGPLGPRSPLPTPADVARLRVEWPGIGEEKLGATLAAAARLRGGTDISNGAPPPRPDLGVFYRAMHDRYVPYDADANAMWDFIQDTWKGCTIHGLTAGHVTGYLFNVEKYVEAILLQATKACQR